MIRRSFRNRVGWTRTYLGTVGVWNRRAQPEVAVDSEGTVHLVYFKGDPSQGDLFYAKSKDGLKFNNPIRVNSVEGTAVAIGNIRGARIAVGRRENVYVV